jgi:hypothetical protein
MNKPLVAIVSCLLGLSACHIEDMGDDCSGPDPFHVEVDYGDAGNAGSQSSGATHTGGGANDNTGARSGSGGTTSAGGDASGGDTGAGGHASTGGNAATPTPCEQESDCKPGCNCDLNVHECLPADEETCGELKTELACSNRRDCVPVYAGLHCSCGQDCACKGGEPGCVCTSFEFFNCATAQ